ncbi:MAG: SoxR reducing system RseC family protein [Bacteroidales bacterium]
MEIIKHIGVVKYLKDGIATVSLSIDNGACSACSVKSVCGSPSVEGEKNVDAKCGDIELLVGERVEIEGAESMGFSAVLLAYILPFIVVLLGIVVAYQLTANELVIALVGLGALLPYYLILRTMKNKLQNIFAFRVIRKL